MPKSRRRKIHARQKSRSKQSENIPVLYIDPLTPMPEPIRALLWLPGQCAVCEKRSSPLIVIAWRNEHGASYGCFFDLKCHDLFSGKSDQEKIAFFDRIEMMADCETAEDTITKSEVCK